jgi:hypothetical protein
MGASPFEEPPEGHQGDLALRHGDACQNGFGYTWHSISCLQQSEETNRGLLRRQPEPTTRSFSLRRNFVNQTNFCYCKEEKPHARSAFSGALIAQLPTQDPVSLLLKSGKAWDGVERLILQ